MKILILCFLPILAFAQDKVMRVYKNDADSLILVKYPQSKTIKATDGMVYKWKVPEPDTARFFESATGEILEATTTFRKIGTTQPPPQTVEQIVDDRNALIKYAPAWVPYTGSIYQDGTAQYTTTKDATATMTFTGNRVEYHAEKRFNHGIAGVKIDGGTEVMVDLYDPRRDNVKAMLFDSGPLTNGLHTITIRMTGTKNPLATETNIIIDYLKFYKVQ